MMEKESLTRWERRRILSLKGQDLLPVALIGSWRDVAFKAEAAAADLKVTQVVCQTRAVIQIPKRCKRDIFRREFKMQECHKNYLRNDYVDHNAGSKARNAFSIQNRNRWVCSTSNQQGKSVISMFNMIQMCNTNSFFTASRNKRTYFPNLRFSNGFLPPWKVSSAINMTLWQERLGT